MTITGHTEHGDAEVARGGEILRSVVGSGVHGIAIAGTDDHDEIGVFVEPPERVLGLLRPTPHYVYPTRPQGVRSGPGDVDLVLYSLRKYLRLATKGNPTALLPLFAPADAVLPLGDELRALTPAVVSREAVRRFLGYLNSQRAVPAVLRGAGPAVRRGRAAAAHRRAPPPEGGRPAALRVRVRRCGDLPSPWPCSLSSWASPDPRPPQAAGTATC